MPGGSWDPPTLLGYTGTGYVDYQKASGDYIEWTVSVGAAGPFTLAFRHANGAGTRSLQLRVNGAVVLSALAFPSTGSWATWREVTAAVTLNAGANTIRLTATGSSGPNVDALTVR
jgi:hypothetical protein